MRSDVISFYLHRLWCLIFHRKHHYLTRDYTIRNKCCRKCGYTFPMAALAFLCLAGSALAQPEAKRSNTVWRAALGNQSWEIRDNGEIDPLLSGTYRSNGVVWALRPAAFDYRSNCLDTVMVGGGKTNRFRLQYLKHEEDDSVTALWLGARLSFRK